MVQLNYRYLIFLFNFFAISDTKHIADSNIYLRRTKLATLVAKYLGHTKIEETLNTYSHMFSTALDSVASVIDSLEDD